jgi:hypothetical protein
MGKFVDVPVWGARKGEVGAEKATRGTLGGLERKGRASLPREPGLARPLFVPVR